MGNVTMLRKFPFKIFHQCKRFVASFSVKAISNKKESMKAFHVSLTIQFARTTSGKKKSLQQRNGENNIIPK